MAGDIETRHFFSVLCFCRLFLEIFDISSREILAESSRQCSKEDGMYDIKDLGPRLKTVEANAPEATKAFWAFDKAAMAPGTVPAKYKELMALAVAFTTQCPYCIKIHAGKAREAGATDQEIAEVVNVAAALRAGAAMTHGTHAF
jgi:AhpD family alkylhydroperoxidase